jgi:23S rRNA U2552 (ribose-2'-O)-methylase RlmE/FtsJ
VLSFALAKYLGEIKEKITHCDKEWDVYKKYTNVYEYIHSQVPYKKRAVSKYKPLSRSYFKMIELIQNFDLLQRASHNKYLSHTQNKPFNSFHLAEGPGGFIEAVANTRLQSNDKYYGMTIVDDKHDGTIPSWSKSEYYLQQHPNIVLEHGADGTGNILSLSNFEWCVEKYGSSMDLITADGGFDFSVDFNNQETNMAALLFAQICYAVCLQKKGGHFVLKIFDCFQAHTIDLLYLLSSFYNQVYITKPLTSRSGNAEKYVVCKGFHFDNYHIFYRVLHQTMCSVLSVSSTCFIHRFLDCDIPLCFISKIDEYNAVFGQQQLENIHYTLSLIEKTPKYDKINQIIKTNVSKCMNWCMKYNVSYNNILYYKSDDDLTSYSDECSIGGGSIPTMSFR